MSSTVVGTAINAYDNSSCGKAASGTSYANGLAINAYDTSSCAFALGIFPDANVNQWENTDLVFAVWTTKGALTLDNATVEFTIRSGSGATVTTKSTDEYSVITFGGTLVVHLTENELPANKTEYYTATITTSDELEYSMTGLIHVSGTAVDTCFMTDVSIPERSIDVIPAMQRGELNEIPERSVSTILCVRHPQTIQNVERTSGVVKTERTVEVIPCSHTSIPITTPARTSEIIVIAPCGKRRGV